MKTPLHWLALRTVVAWLATLVLVFPLLWLVMTAFKTEVQAIATPPLLLFKPTLQNFATVNAQSDYLR